MSLWRQVARGVRSLVNRSAVDRDITDEVEQYLDEAAASFEASGLSPDEARRAARRQLGSIPAVREEVHAYGWEHIVETTIAEMQRSQKREEGNRTHGCRSNHRALRARHPLASSVTALLRVLRDLRGCNLLVKALKDS